MTVDPNRDSTQMSLRLDRWWYWPLIVFVLLAFIPWLVLLILLMGWLAIELSSTVFAVWRLLQAVGRDSP